VNVASGVWRFALGACWLLSAIDARADEQPKNEPPKDQPPKKRAVPNYDGRGGAPEPRVRKALWVPRVLLFPAYVVSEYVVRRPLAAGITYAEKQRWPSAISDFLALDEVHPVGVVPFMLIDFGFEPSAGLYAYWDNAGFKGHSLRLRGSTWGPHWLSGTLKERFQFENFEIFLKGKLTRRPDFTFYGLGPDTRESNLTRYAGRTAYAHFQTRLAFGGRSAFETIAGYRGAKFGPSDYDSDDRGQPGYQPSLDEAVAAGKLAEPPGFRDGYRAPFAGARLLLDSRGKKQTRDGVRLDVLAEQSVDLANSPSSGWLRYGGTVAGFIDLMQGGRFLAVAFNVILVDPIGERDVPFTQQAALGGSGTMPGLRFGRLYGRSSAVVDLRYTWPIWLSLRGSLQAAVGNVFGEHFEGLRPGRARLSTALGLETNGGGDDIFQALVGFGTETFETGAELDSIRFVVGVREGF
jgi:hypothetical protein